MRPLHTSHSDIRVAAILFLSAATQAAMFPSVQRNALISSSTTDTVSNPDASPSSDEYRAEYAKGPKPKPKVPSIPSPKTISAPADAPKSGPGMPVIAYYHPEKLDMRPSTETYMYGGYREWFPVSFLVPFLVFSVAFSFNFSMDSSIVFSTIRLACCLTR